MLANYASKRPPSGVHPPFHRTHGWTIQHCFACPVWCCPCLSCGPVDSGSKRAVYRGNPVRLTIKVATHTLAPYITHRDRLRDWPLDAGATYGTWQFRKVPTPAVDLWVQRQMSRPSSLCSVAISWAVISRGPMS